MNRRAPFIDGYHDFVFVGNSRLGEVWRANRLDDGRQVAIKLCTTQPEQFASGHQTIANLAHPHLARVTEQITVNESPGVVMEWIGGGTLAERLAQGIDVWTLGDIALGAGYALDAIHSAGHVHGDVRPEHLLFRRDGAAVLTGFDLCSPAGQRPAQTNDLLRTPSAYRSPETRSEFVVTPASDIYSFACLLYECLAGVPPLGNLNETEISEPQLGEAVPRLPAHLESFQWVLDRALAKQPENRFQSAGEFAGAFAEIARRSSAGSVVLRTDAVDPQEILWIGTPILEGARRIDAGTRRRRRLRDFPGGRLALGIGIVLLLSFWISALVDRSETAVGVLAILGWVRDPAVVEAWDNARALDRDPNQSLVTVAAGYRRVLALDPGDARAREALEALAAESRLTVEQALAAGQVTDADARLQEYLRVFPGDEAMSALGQQVADRRTADALVNRALATLRRQGFDNAKAREVAIRTYREVLRLVPEHPVARSELDGIAAESANRAREAIDRGEFDSVVPALEQAAAASPGLPLLAQLRKDVLTLPEIAAELENLLQQGDQWQAGGALVTPEGSSAAEAYLRVLAIEPGNVNALKDLTQVVERISQDARLSLHAGNMERASRLVSRLGVLGLDRYPDLAISRTTRNTMEHHGSVVRNLELARARLERGLITAPENDNAILFLRRVLDQDQGNRLATALMDECAARIATVAQEAYAADMKNLGRTYLDKALQLRPTESEWLALRKLWEQDD
jgi:tetratricopeptide (TPR) repeat protein/tRNA A-37 threonylcarbamoyl transferase component Bud32